MFDFFRQNKKCNCSINKNITFEVKKMSNQLPEVGQVSDSQELEKKSAFSVDESSYKTISINIKPTQTLSDYAETQTENEKLKVEIDNLKQQLAGVKNHQEQQKLEAANYKKQRDDAKRKLEIATHKLCQCITSNETQCTKTAYKGIKYNGLLFWVCKQHLKQYPDAKTI
jgi:flagellar biosynthesis GTPase FlhF